MSLIDDLQALSHEAEVPKDEIWVGSLERARRAFPPSNEPSTVLTSGVRVREVRAIGEGAIQYWRNGKIIWMGTLPERLDP